MRKVLVFVMALSLSVMLLGCSGTDTSKEAKDTTQDTSQEDKQDTSQEKAEPTQDKTEQKTAKKKTAETMKLRIRF